MQNLYGVDWQGPVSQYEDVEHVKVPSIAVNITTVDGTTAKYAPTERVMTWGSHFVVARTFVSACF